MIKRHFDRACHKTDTADETADTVFRIRFRHRVRDADVIDAEIVPPVPKLNRSDRRAVKTAQCGYGHSRDAMQSRTTPLCRHAA